MKINVSLILLALFTSSSVASWGFGKSAYNKWHETELERWLSDNDIPYPNPADRKDLENLVKENWNQKVGSPYQDWDIGRLQHYLSTKGVEVNEKSKDNKNWLVETVKKNWYEAENSAEEAWGSVKSWIFDSWTDSQLKAFLDRHGIPSPHPRKRDTLLSTARENYHTIAEKLGETAAYPGNWLYEAWTDSDLKKWLDEHGYPAPQPSTREKLIAAVRRNARLASLKTKSTGASVTDSAHDAKESMYEKVFNSWSDSQIKEWCDKNGIKVPQGSTRNELLALARKNKAYLKDDTLSASVSSLYDQATNTVGSSFSKATDTAADYSQAAFDKAVAQWSDSRLKEYLDSRGVPVPQGSKRDELLAQVRLQRHKAASGYGAWTFDTWTYDNLKSYVDSQATKATSAASSSASATREELIEQAKKAYAAASSSGGSVYASVTSKLAQATDAAKANVFDTWSESDLKSYLDSYGIKTYQGSTRNELVAEARRAQHLFLYGTTTPSQTVYEKIKNTGAYLYNQVAHVFGLGEKKVEQAKHSMKEGATTAYDRGYEKGQEGYDRAYEKGQEGYDKVYEKGQQVRDKVREEL